MKRLKPSRILAFLLLVVCLHVFTRSQTDGFRLTKATVRHSYPFEGIPQSPPSSLKQPFYYLGKGVQFYVFLGQDNQTILKLFKHHHMGPSIDTIKQVTPQLFAARFIAKREKRMHHLLKSAQIALNDLADETGVVYTHLSKTSGEVGSTLVYDKIGIVHKVDLDTTEFLLQKRAETVKERLDSLFREGQIADAISAIKELQTLVENRSRKGIKNKDGNILENCGFIGNQAVQIDVGSFTYRSKSTHPNPHQKAVMRCTLELLGWVKKYYPDHLNTCKKELFYENTL